MPGEPHYQLQLLHQGFHYGTESVFTKFHHLRSVPSLYCIIRAVLCIPETAEAVFITHVDRVVVSTKNNALEFVPSLYYAISAILGPVYTV